MTAHLTMARMPFAPLDSPRLQHLQSAKNCQNGIISSKSINGKTFDGKSSFDFKSTAPKISFLSTTPATKRGYEATAFDDADGENVDPAIFTSPSKKSKTSFYDLITSKPSSITTGPCTPAKFNATTTSGSSMRAPLTAPAGRSPKRKTFSLLKSRRISAPFTRIDPPSFTSASHSTLPFSLDAALSGTFTAVPAPAAAPRASAAMLPTKVQPKDWFFSIHEDTADEEAANLMEHSTLVLDLSSDDEGSPSKRARDDVGKENTPPAGYDAVAASRPGSGAGVRQSLAEASEVAAVVEPVVRKVVGEEMCDGQRTPLANLEREPFFAEGCDDDAHVLVEEQEKVELCDAPVEFTAGGKAADVVVEEKKAEEVIVFEDVVA